MQITIRAAPWTWDGLHKGQISTPQHSSYLVLGDILSGTVVLKKDCTDDARRSTQSSDTCTVLRLVAELGLTALTHLRLGSLLSSDASWRRHGDCLGFVRGHGDGCAGDTG